MLKRLPAFAALILIAATLAGCGAVQPCDATANASTGPCSVGRHHDNSA